MSKIVEEYSLYVYKPNVDRWVKYCSYTTLEKVKNQVQRYKEDMSKNKKWYQRSGWNLWKGNEPINISEYQTKIIHRRYEVVKTTILEEEINE